jgi:RHS repeat-associated protein
MVPGSPAGSYQLGGFDNINFYNGHLNFSLPLLKVGGRGGAQIPVLLPIEQPWHAEKDWGDTYVPVPNWWNASVATDVPTFSPGSLDARLTGEGLDSWQCPGSVDPQLYYGQSLTRLTFTAPDGTEYELRDQLTGGKPATELECHTTGALRGTVFVTADGSSATFVSDDDIRDELRPGEGGQATLSGYLYLKDGTRFRIAAGGWIRSMRDRNGNTLTFEYYGIDATYTPVVPIPRNSAVFLYKITDSLNREIIFNYDLSDAQYGLHDTITYKGFGGAARTIRVSHAKLHDLLRTGYSIQNYAQLFPSLNGSSFTDYDPYKTSAVWLPDGRKYSFLYNSHGELAQVDLPTGGFYQYDHDSGVDKTDESGGMHQTFGYAGAYRRVVARRAFLSGGVLANSMTISRPEHFVFDGSNYVVGNRGYVDVDHVDGGGSTISRERHFYNGSPSYSIIRGASTPVAYSEWREGREYKTELFNETGTLLRRVEQTWQQRAPVGWWAPPFCPVCTTDNAPSNDTRVVEMATTLADTNQVTKQTFDYDQFNNQTDSRDYDYGVGAAGALLRRTHTDYLTTNPANGVDYTSRDTAHIRNLPAQVSVFDAAGAEQSRSTFEYDYYVSSGGRAPLTNRAGITGLDPAFTTSYTTRGNVTAYSGWLLPNTPVASYARYDIAGNAVASVNPLGHVSQVTFTDSFSDGIGRNTYAYPSQTTSAIPAPSPGPNSDRGSNTPLTSSTVYDFSTGAVISSTDANGKTTTLSYADESGTLDLLDRLRKVTRPDGGRTRYEYSDSVGDLYLRTLTDLDAARSAESRQYFDGLGRKTRSFLYDGSTPAPWSVTDAYYDALGRVSKVSNPYRAASAVASVPATCSSCTTTTYDALGRVLTVTTPDGATVVTSYSGSQVTVTDQKGKARSSVSDALGRLTSVTEAPGVTNYGFLTTYAYDAIGNLRRVDQGGQQRFFMYDSLGRLIRAKNPEQTGSITADADFPGLTDSTSGTPNGNWSMGYTYDANGNLYKRKDARNIVTTYSYDNLNRLIRTDYSDGTPYTLNSYDLATNGRGRLYSDYESSTTGTLNFALSYDAVGRPTSRGTGFYLNGAWVWGFDSSRTYDLAGNILSQTYPSGHTVHYSYDAAGRLGNKGASPAFRGNLGDGAQRTYSSGVSYDEASRMSEEQFGTQVPLYHRLAYNSRGQVTGVNLGTSATTGVPTEWNRGALSFDYGTTHDNGNLVSQTHKAPDDDQVTGYTQITQTYDYDPLNRISSVSEDRMGTPSFQQAYTYDRWGNRQINAGATTEGLNERQFSTDVATNRIGVPAGQGGSMQYDDAGNLTYDTYSDPGKSVGARAYDAENRMTYAESASVVSGTYNDQYVYDAAGRRTRRRLEFSETWQVYGFSGELLAEYVGGALPASPQKEYGYRGGELLITASAATSSGTTDRVNVAAAANGAIATAQNFTPDGAYAGLHFQPSYANDGVKHINSPGGDQYWRDEHGLPSWLEIGFAGPQTIDEVDVIAVADHPAYFSDPAEGQTFTQFGVTAFEVQYWTGSAWAGVPGGSVPGNNLVWKKVTFTPVTTAKIRIVVSGAADGVARIAEVEAYTGGGGGGQQGGSGGAEVNWLVSDHLGTPRMVVDQTGSLAGVTRHDYLPFGEDLAANIGGRAIEHGYAVDNVRQKFIGSEYDEETKLDFMQARYYASAQGRFTSVDPLMASAASIRPQTWNRYSYALNNPLRFVDPSGLSARGTTDDSQWDTGPACVAGTAGCYPRFNETVTVTASNDESIVTTNGTVATTLDLPGLPPGGGSPNELPPNSSIPEQYGVNPEQTIMDGLSVLSSNVRNMIYQTSPDFWYAQASLPLLGGGNVAISKDLQLYGGFHILGALGGNKIDVPVASEMRGGGQAGFGYFLKPGLQETGRHDAMVGQDLNLSAGPVSGTIPLNKGNPPSLMLGLPFSSGANVSSNRHLYDLRRLF